MSNKKLTQREIEVLTELETCKDNCPLELNATEDVNFSNIVCNSIKHYMDIREAKRNSENRIVKNIHSKLKRKNK